MPISDVVSVTITANTQTVARKGFGTQLLMAYHTAHLDRIRSYKDFPSVLVDHAATTVIARAAAVIFGQNPRPELLKIGRRALPMTQKFNLIPVTTTSGFKYILEFVTPAGTVLTAQFINGGAETVATIIAGLKTAIDALAMAVTTVNNGPGTSLDITANVAGQLFDLEDKSASQPGNIKIKNITTNPGISTDIAAVLAVDSDFYWVCLDSNSEAEGLAAAATLSALSVMFGTDSSDNEIDDVAVTTDYFSDLETSAYARVFGIRGKHILSFAGAGACARQAPFTPGEFDLFLKTLAGVKVMNLTSTVQSNIESKSGNHYTVLAGLNVVRPSKTFSGQFIDIQPLVDYLTARISENVFSSLQANNKYAYDDKHVDLVKGIIKGVLSERVGRGLRDGTIQVTAPLVANVSVANRAGRILPDVNFQAEIDGAIHKVLITGVLSA